MAPQLEGEGPAGLGAAGEQVQVEAVVGYPVHGERDEVDGPQKQAGSCKDQQEDRPGKGEEKGGQGRRQGGKQIGQAAPKIIKPEGDLVPVWGLQQALAASAGEVEAAQDQAAILAEQGERAHPEGEEAVAGEQAADQVTALVQDGLEPEGEDQAGQGGQQDSHSIGVQSPHEEVAPCGPQKGGRDKDSQLPPGDGVPLQTISPFCCDMSKKYK